MWNTLTKTMTTYTVAENEESTLEEINKLFKI